MTLCWSTEQRSSPIDGPENSLAATLEAIGKLSQRGLKIKGAIIIESKRCHYDTVDGRNPAITS